MGLPHTLPDDAYAVAERLKQNVAAIALSGELAGVQLSVTIGVAIATPEDDLDDLIAHADNLLHVLAVSEPYLVKLGYQNIAMAHDWKR